MKNFFLVFGLLFLTGCLGSQSQSVGENDSFLFNYSLGTVVGNGDTVAVDYVGSFPDGVVFDTSVESVAVANGLYNAQRTYEPLEFTAGAGQMISGFDKAVVGMRLGESKIVVLPPEEAYGEWNESLVESVRRSSSLSRDQNFSLEEFTMVSGQDPVVGLNVSLGDWSAVVSGVSETSVSVRLLPELGGIIRTQFWPVEVVDFNESSIVTRISVSEGQTVTVADNYGYPILLKVYGVTESEVFLDANPPMAGKTLVFNITLRSVNGETE